MSSTSLRKVATAVVLTLVLGLAAGPATARPWGPPEPTRIDDGLLTRVWLWLAEIWATPATPEQALEKALAPEGQASPDSLTAPGSLRRGGTYDPNG
jgi:hypothetical protein